MEGIESAQMERREAKKGAVEGDTVGVRQKE